MLNAYTMFINEINELYNDTLSFIDDVSDLYVETSEHRFMNPIHHHRIYRIRSV